MNSNTCFLFLYFLVFWNLAVVFIWVGEDAVRSISFLLSIAAALPLQFIKKGTNQQWVVQRAFLCRVFPKEFNVKSFILHNYTNLDIDQIDVLLSV